MTLQQMRYFLATCRHGSFTAAAEALYVAQPSVAEQIRRLEQELGLRLFVRTGRRLELTEPGQNLKLHAERVLSAMEAAEAAMQTARSLKGGVASMGTFGIAHRYLVDEVISSFVARYPDVGIRVIGNHSSEVIDQVRNGELEAGLVTLPVEEPTLAVEPVMSDEILLAAATDWSDEDPVSLERLAGERLIVWPAISGWRDSIRRQLRAWAEESGVGLVGSIEVENMESALELTARGLGVTYVPRTISERPDVQAGLHYVPFEFPIFETYAFISRRDHTLSPASAELVRMARRQMCSYGRPPLSQA